jgi:hypothetical protein
MRGFCHLPARSWLAQHVGGGAREAAGHLPRAAGGQGKTQARRFRISLFVVKGPCATKLLYGLICGGMSGNLTSLRRTEARCASAKSIRPARASTSCLAVEGSCSTMASGFSVSPRPKNDYVIIGHTTIILASSILCPRGALPRVERAVTSLAGRGKAE